MLHVPDDLAQVASQVLAGEGEGFLVASEGERRRQALGLCGRDGQTQSYSCAAAPAPAAHLLLVAVLGKLRLWIGGDAVRVAVAERLCRAGLKGALQLHHIEGILRKEREEKGVEKIIFSPCVIFIIYLRDNEKQHCHMPPICAQSSVAELMSVLVNEPVQQTKTKIHYVGSDVGSSSPIDYPCN